MKNSQFVVNDDSCTQCGMCAADCPNDVIAIEKDLPDIVPEHADDCIECQHCLAVCPTGALSVFGVDPQKSIPLASGAFPTREQMKALVRGRRSVRQFRPGDVEPALVADLLSDLAHAPTGCNDRALEFLVIDSRREMDALRERVVSAVEAGIREKRQMPEFLVTAAEAYRRDGTDQFFRGAPHLLVVSAAQSASCGAQDVILALAYFELLAQCSGLGTTWCGFLDFTAAAVPEVRALLGLSPDAPFYSMMFGYPAIRYARTVQRDAAAKIRRYSTR
jgi:nitroreductase/NAD-dependent dihydropyrimidine dehydrogenase PreA subunit